MSHCPTLIALLSDGGRKMALEDAVMKVVILAGGDGNAHPADLVGENDSGTIDEGSVLVFKPEPKS